MVSATEAFKIGNKFHIDWDVIPVKTFQHALEVELEHKDVTHGDMDMTAQIAIAHLKEYPDYYSRLDILEHDAELYWITHKKPSPVLLMHTNYHKKILIVLLIVIIFFIIVLVLKLYKCPVLNFDELNFYKSSPMCYERSNL